MIRIFVNMFIAILLTIFYVVLEIYIFEFDKLLTYPFLFLMNLILFSTFWIIFCLADLDKTIEKLDKRVEDVIILDIVKQIGLKKHKKK